MSEWNYIFEERLGILTDGRREPTKEEIDIAAKEADEHCKKIGEPIPCWSMTPISSKNQKGGA